MCGGKFRSTTYLDFKGDNVNGYDAYLTNFTPKPQYRRVVYYAHVDCPLFRWLADQGRKRCKCIKNYAV